MSDITPTAPTPPTPHAAGPIRTSPLAAFHAAHGAHMVPFSGWEMPLYYSGILEEHRAVREGVGLFDVSHLGVLTVSGGRAGELLARRTTANVPALRPGRARYAFFLEGTGRMVDDLLVSRLDDGTDLTPSFLAAPNAARAAEVEEILRHHRAPDTTITSWRGKVADLAVQGPGATALLESTMGWDLSHLKGYHVAAFPSAPSGGARAGHLVADLANLLADSILVSRVGYTGENGYELLLPATEGTALAERLTAAGAVPCGLGARDVLRLESGFLLSGQDFNRDHTPIEAGQDRFVDFDHEFVGRAALEKQRADGLVVRLAGLEVETPGVIPRHGTPIESEGKAVGIATSGGFSPSLGHGIGLAYLPVALAIEGTTVDLVIRGQRAPARVVRLPFRAPTRPG
jgi:aminomethyltransferase